MKRAIIFVVILTLANGLRARDNGVTPLPTAPPPTAAAIAEKQNAEERYQRLAADVQALQAANEELQNKINGLQEEMRKLREDQSHQGDHAATADDVKQLASKIEEVDKKRADDHVAVTEEVRNAIAGLEKTLGAGAPAPTRATPPRSVNNNATPANVENGFVYTVQSGDSLGAIVKAYNADFKSKGLKQITLRQTRDANPNVNWDKLRVGQKIVIPRPAE